MKALFLHDQPGGNRVRPLTTQGDPTAMAAYAIGMTPY